MSRSRTIQLSKICADDSILPYLRKTAATMLDAMLAQVEEDDLNIDVQGYLQRAEKARQLVGVRSSDQQLVDSGRYNLRRRDAEYHPGDLVLVSTPIRRRGFSEKLLSQYFAP